VTVTQVSRFPFARSLKNTSEKSGLLASINMDLGIFFFVNENNSILREKNNSDEERTKAKNNDEVQSVQQQCGAHG